MAEVRRTPAPVETRRFRFIDLFAGIGGTRLGFQSAGGVCVWTSEWDEYALKTYRANFPSAEGHTIEGDITKVDAGAIPEHDVLVAGFPCQPFSIAGVSKKNALGRPHGFDCGTQGTLFFDVERILAEHKPRAFLLENVKNLQSHDAGRTFAVIKRTLQKTLGYRISPLVVDARAVVPQHRERIFIVGFLDHSVEFDWDAVLHHLGGPDAGPRLGEAVLHPEDGSEPPLPPYTDERGRVHRKYVLTDKLWKYLQAYAVKHRGKGNGFGYGLVGPNDVARTLSARYYKDGSEILVRRKRGNPRRMTPRECARLMGFADSFKIPVSDTRAYKQFGNSVVVPVVEAIAAVMKAHLEGTAPLPAQTSFDLKVRSA
jgi:DNA (cytosine-5)-methyltransferase 1